MENSYLLRIGDMPKELTRSISREIYNYLVGLIHDNDLIGSGTFVKVGGKRGILTAYHVPHNRRREFDFRPGSQDVLGLILEERAHRFEIPLGLGYARLFDIGIPTMENLGPDLAFIEINPSHFLDTLEAKMSFYSLDFKRDEKKRKSLSEEGVMVISGFHHEDYTNEKNIPGFSTVKGFRGFAGFTCVTKRLEHQGFDLCDVSVQYSEGLDLPQSFGGYSGGGLWQVDLIKTKITGKLEHGDPILAGVIFYQQQENDDSKILRCHYGRSVYDMVIKRLQREPLY